MGKYETMVEPRLDDIRRWITEEHATMKEIAQALGVSYSGFRKYAKDYPQLAGILTENRQKANEEAIGSFWKRVTGYEAKEVTRERIDGKMVVVKEVTKHIPPDVGAGQFWLTNAMPDRFKNRQSIDAEISDKIGEFDDET